MTGASLLVRGIARRSLSASASSRFSSQIARASVVPGVAPNAFFGGSSHGNETGRRGMAMMSAGDALAKLAAESPHKDVIRYEHKNDKWTLRKVEFFADALATGLMEHGFQPGDVVLSWLPLHFVEQHILQFACSKGGLILYHLDPAPAITDKEGAKASLKKALEITEANIFITQEAGDDVNYVQLTKEVIPEIRIFDFSEGMPFFTPRFPHLRYPIHTGFDNEDKEGMYPIKHMQVPSGELSNIIKATGSSAPTGSTPLMGELVTGKDGLPEKGKIMTNEEVFKSGVWPEFTSILKKEYREVEGVGVVF